MSVAIIVVKITRAGKRITIDERKEVEREIMTRLSRRLSLINDNSTMEEEFTSKVSHLAGGEAQRII